MRRSTRAAANKPINYKSFGTQGIRLPPETTSQASSSDESDADISTLEQTFNLYQSLYESDTSTQSVDANLSQLVRGLTIKDQIMENDIKNISIEQNVLSSEIADIGTDYDIEFMTYSELEQLFKEVKTMRNRLKVLHNEILQSIGTEEYEKNFLKSYNENIHNAQTVIQRVNARRKEVRPDEKNAQRKKSLSDFLMKEVKSTITSLEAVFKEDPSAFSYDELVLAERNLSSHQQSINNLTKHMEKLLVSEHFQKDETDIVTKSYDALAKLKSTYITKLESTLKVQEIAKEQKFQSSKLNIKLTKFKGYDSSSDFYSFKSDFEKLHSKSTPSAHLPDLIKNNYLEGPALTLVKGVDNIEEIWRRLKLSYGDPKLLLSKKLSDIQNTTRLWRVRSDPEKQIESLSKMLNFMRDTMNLAQKHQIENFLLYGKTLEDVYQLMDDTRQTKWFSFLEGKTLHQSTIWEEFIKFLEKEISIQQLKMLQFIANNNQPW
ncbi:uncharacterized protein [Clytia hemisphaerica]|uniref:uncharacterized protein n=1 Tax=Clytia hemisphaerica TaxID=252671 RepID=UPI0034D4D8B1